MHSKTVKNNSIEIATQSFGKLADPMVILIMGATAQGVMWNESFCESLAQNGFLVIRYDHRDTGKSSRVDYDTAPYLLDDLSEDVLAIIKAYGKDKTHLLGASMGSFVAQNVAIKHNEVVATLCCVMSSPKHTVFVDGFAKLDTSHHALPPSHPKILEFYEEILSLSSSSVDEDLAMHRQIWQKLSGSDHNIDTRVFEGKILKRLKNSTYIHNHSYALANSPSLEKELYKIKVPTLVIHGDDDHILPVEHGRQLAKEIPQAKYIEYLGLGHFFTPAFYQQLLRDWLIFVSGATPKPTRQSLQD
ncbi:MAG: alpha/beta fold hydrolase [Rickettsiales bacterium]